MAAVVYAGDMNINQAANVEIQKLIDETEPAAEEKPRSLPVDPPPSTQDLGPAPEPETTIPAPRKDIDKVDETDKDNLNPET